jgi:hydrogenase maturation protease
MTDGSVEGVLVLGLGNLLLGDDAVGLRLLEALQSRIGLPACPGEESSPEYLDGGTQGLALLPWLSERRAVLILDAVGLGAAPGTVHVLRDQEIEEFRARRASTAHEGNALELLAVARLLGAGLAEVAVVGIEPASVATGIGLSAPVEAALPEGVERARGVLREMLRISYVPRHSGEDSRRAAN